MYKNISEYSELDSSSTLADYNSAQSYTLPSVYSDSASVTADQGYGLPRNSPNHEYDKFPRPDGTFEISNSDSNNGVGVAANNAGNILAKNYTEFLTAENKGK